TEWLDFQISNVGIAANTASHQNISNSFATALGLSNLAGFTVLTTFLQVAHSPDAAVPVGGSVRCRSAFVMQDNSLAGAAGDGPLSQPYRDWFGMSQLVIQNSTGGVAQSRVGDSGGPEGQALWHFRSKRKFHDLTDALFLITEADVAIHYTAMGRVLVSM